MNPKKITITAKGNAINAETAAFLKNQFCNCNKQFESLAKQEEQKQDEPKFKNGDLVKDVWTGKIGTYIGSVNGLRNASVIDIDGSAQVTSDYEIDLIDSDKIKKEKPLGQHLYESIFDNGNASPEWDKLSDKYKESYQTTAEEFVARLGE